MKKILLIFSLSLISTLGFSQLYKTVKIDSLVSVSLPAIYTQKDTLGQQTFSAKSSYGFIVVNRISNAANNAPLKKEKDLTKVFKNYENDVAQVGNGSIENEKDTTVGTLKGRVFTLKTDDGTVQYRRFLFVYTKDASYNFQYFYKEFQSGLVKDEIKTFFSSIKLAPDLQRNDQYLIANGKGMPGNLKALLYGGGGFIVVIIILFATIRRRRNRQAPVKKTRAKTKH